MKTLSILHIIWALFAQTVLIYATDNDSKPVLSEADTKLIKAATSPRGVDNVEAVKAALARGADINAKEVESGQTALMASCLRGKINIVKYLLEAGADTSIGEGTGYTPPHGAAFQGRPDVMEALIEAGVDVNVPHKDGFVPLHRTCWGNEERHAETLRVLLKHGVPHSIEHVEDGSTCADMAASIHILKVLEEETGEKFIEEGDEEFFGSDDDDDDEDDDDDYVSIEDLQNGDDDDDDDDGDSQKEEL